MKRVTRIELATEAWEASVLPLNYTREIVIKSMFTALFEQKIIIQKCSKMWSSHDLLLLYGSPTKELCQLFISNYGKRRTEAKKILFTLRFLLSLLLL